MSDYAFEIEELHCAFPVGTLLDLLKHAYLKFGSNVFSIEKFKSKTASFFVLSPTGGYFSEKILLPNHFEEILSVVTVYIVAVVYGYMA